MATIGELFVKLNANTSNFDRGMDQAKGKASGFGSVLGSISKQVASFMVYDVGKKLVTGFLDATKAGIDYNATLETSRIKWETLLGTQEKANKMLKDIEKFAATTPFEKIGVDKMAGFLHNAGFEGEKLFDQLTKFGDIAGAFDVQSDSLQEMVRQYSQVQNAGVAYTEDLNILEDRSIPIMKNIAAVMGVPADSIRKLASEGKISADIYNQALDRIAKSSEGGMSKLSESFNGIKSTISDTIGQISGILAKPIFDKLKEGAVQVRDVLDKIAESLGSEAGFMGTIQRFAPGIEPFVQTAISIFTTMGESVGVIIQSMTNFWNEHSSWLMPLITFVWGFISNVILNTITAIGTIVQSGLAVIDGVINFFQNLFKGNFQGCWESIKQIFSNAIAFVISWMQVNFVAKGISLVKNMATGIPNLITGLWNAGKNLFSQGVSACINFVKNLLSGATSNFNTLRTFGANAFQALWSVAKTMMSNLLNSVISNIRQVPTTISNFMNQAVNVLKGINLFSIGKNMIQGLINGIKNMAGNVVGAITSVAEGAVKGVRKFLGINSPSKVFMQFGKWTGEGLAIGIDDENNRVAKASKGLASSVIGGYNANLRGIKTNSNNNTHVVLEPKPEQVPIIINIDGRKVFEVMSPYMGRAVRGL
ncbi:tape measure protein [Terrisporobacter sp.]|uniref:tape measure protein n=1 Tax=Terrisporobacter sp. TaxID=1965305 RepID=UPI002632AA2C|nr:tape measure protein [Terrisporobacter sp.]